MNDESSIESMDVSDEEREILAYLMEKERLSQMGSRRVAPRQNSGPAPLSFAQQRLWLLEQMSVTGAAYNWSIALRISGELDIDLVDATLTEIVRRHEVLRSTIHVEDEDPFQVVSPLEPIHAEFMDLMDMPRDELQDKVQSMVNNAKKDTFDLEKGPLLKARLLRLREQDHALILSMHHIVSDGWSLNVLLQEISALYGVLQSENSAAIPDLSVQYADYAVWQRNWLTGEELNRQLDYWESQLREAPILELPSDRPRPTIQTYMAPSKALVLALN